MGKLSPGYPSWMRNNRKQGPYHRPDHACDEELPGDHLMVLAENVPGNKTFSSTVHAHRLS